MPQIYNNGLYPTLWGSQGNVKPVTNITNSNLTIGGLNGQIQYNDNGVLNGTSESFYDKTVGMLTLGPVSNVNITGGIPGQVLTKDAYGNMIWASSNIPNQPQIHFDVPVTGVSQSFAHPNLATFQDSTYAGVFRNGILMPTDAYTIIGSVLSINTMLLAGDRVDVLETAAGIVQTGNIGNVNLNGDPTTFLDGTGNWQVINANVVVGTVAPLNLDGNIAHWLRGDGVWANIPVSEGNISNIDLDGNVVHFLRGDGNWTNIAIPTGNIANTNYDGNADHYLNGQGNWVPVVSGGIPGGADTQLQFNNNGVFGGVPGSVFDGTNLTLGSNTNIKLTGGNVNDVLITDGTGNLSWRNLVNYAAVPRMEFQVLSDGAGQTFTNANLAVYPNSNYATVFRNGVLMDPTDYTITGTNITFSIPLYATESIDIAASASVGPGGTGGANGTVSNVDTFGSGLGFSLTGGPITTTGVITLTTPNATQLRSSLLIGNVANANFTGNGNVVLAGNGSWRQMTTVAGNTTEIQYNLNGVLTATNNMRYDTANNTVTFEGITKLLDDVIVEGDIIPFQSNLYNLGNSTHRWKDLYLSNNSVILGDTTLSSENGLKIDGELAVTAPNDTITIGNIAANTLSGDGSNISNIAFANVTGAGNIAIIDLSGDSNQILAGNGTWVDITPTNIPYMEWTATVSGSNQVFTNANLISYTLKSDLSLFRNGVLVLPEQFTLSGNSITVYSYVEAGDDLSVISKSASNGGSSAAAGNIGQLQVAGAGGTVVASNRYYIGANGTGGINSSRDTYGSGFATISYHDSPSAVSFITGRSRGTKAAPQPVQVGDRICGLYGFAYTGNATGSLDGITGYATSIAAGISTQITSLPIANGSTPGMSVILVSTNSAANVSKFATFDENGMFSTPKLRVWDQTAVPPTSTSPGTQGQVAFTAEYVYYCYSDNNWVRSPMATW